MQAVVAAAAPAEAAAKEPRSDTKAIPPALDPSRAIATAITQPATKPGTQLVAAAELPPPLPNGHERSQADPLVALRAETFACRLCALCESRRIVVFGEGNRAPEVLFLGEAPGAVEDQTGQPLVGPAGQLFDKILQGAMGLDRADIYLANINKCRPPGNRTPTVEEVAACMPFLTRQVSILRPKVIVALGRGAAQSLLGTNAAMRDLRGCELNFAGIPVVVTWHPAFLLQDPSRKRETWEDIKRVNRLLGRPEVPPERPTES
ncbi:uracil-DNA glycosylase [Planctomycetota bacterium]|nr:uracil-DNA glycosylase [Planctomycetota bacterium]